MSEVVFPLACYAVGYEDFENRWSEYFQKKDQIKPFLMEDERFKDSNLRVVVPKFKDAQGLPEYGIGVASAYGVAYVKSAMEACETD